MTARAPTSLANIVAVVFIAAHAATPALGQLRADSAAVSATPPEPGVRPATATVAADPIDLLVEQPGGFTYDLSVPGWPSGFSFRGLSPNDLGVHFGDVLMDDPFTGRPRFDLVPIQLAVLPDIRLSTSGVLYGAAFQPRRFAEPHPLTEATYWSSSAGLQSIRILHQQQRVFRTRDDPADSTIAAADSVALDQRAPRVPPHTRMQTAVSYHGLAATGEYPGSRVRRGRQLSASLGLSGARWSAEVLELYNGRSVGAHEGVNPPIFRRLGATVRQADAVRVSRRNDLGVNLAYSIINEPLRVGAVWTAATERYTTAADTVEARSTRLSWSLSQRISRGIPVSILVAGNRDVVTGSRGMEADATSSFLFAGIRGDATTRRARGTASVGFVQPAGASAFAAIFNGEAMLAGVGLHASAATTPARSSLIDEVGFSNYVSAGPSGDERARYSAASLGLSLRLRHLSAKLEGFVTLATDATEYFATPVADSVAVVRVDGTTRTTGASATVSLRDSATRGFYGRVRLDTYRTGGDSSAERLRIAGAHPDYYTTAQVGYRRTLFAGDLIGDFAIRGRAWPDFAGRALHAQTGLLVVPLAVDVVPASWVVDVVVTAKVRSASIFVLYENMFSGTQVLEGNQLVVGYPLEQQRFRFGVWWPIAG